MNIFRFDDIPSYLPIINGALASDLIIVVSLLYLGLYESDTLRYWYKTFREGAIMADVLILILAFILTRYLYPLFFKEESIWYFLGLFLVVQILHDLAFYGFFTIVPRGVNKMMDVFKNYAKEMSYRAIVGDSILIVLTALIAYGMSSVSTNANIITLITLLYLVPYIIYTE